MISISSSFRGSARGIFQQLEDLISSRDGGNLTQERFQERLTALMMSLPRLSVSSMENDDGDAFEAVLDADGRLRVQTLESRGAPQLSAEGAKKLRDFIETLYV